MKSTRSLFVALVLLLAPLAIQGKSGQQKVIISPSPAANDLAKAFEPGQFTPEVLETLRQRWVGVKFYQSQLLPNLPETIFGWNTYAHLRDAGVFKAVKDLGLDTSLEVSALRVHNCLERENNIVDSVESIEEALRNLKKAEGGDAHDVASDTALHNCGLRAEETGHRIAWWSRVLEQFVLAHTGKLLPIGLIEAYPEAKLLEHLGYIETIRKDRAARGLPMLAYYDLDVDLERVRRETSEVILAVDVIRISRAVHSMGMEFGLIIIGNDGPDELAYFDGASERLGLFSRLGLLDPAITDRIIVQSWATRTTTKKMDLPINTRVGDRAHLDFLLHTVRCLVGMDECWFYR